MADAESPIKHTSGGEMPDTSETSELTRRLRAAAPVLSNELGLKSVVWPAVILVAVGIGSYFLWRRRQEQE